MHNSPQIYILSAVILDHTEARLYLSVKMAAAREASSDYSPVEYVQIDALVSPFNRF